MDRELKTLGIAPERISRIEMVDGTSLRVSQKLKKTKGVEEGEEIIGRESSVKVLEDLQNRKTIERKELRGKKVRTFKKEVTDEEEPVCTCGKLRGKPQEELVCTCKKCPMCGKPQEEQEEEPEQELVCTCKTTLRGAQKPEPEPEPRKTITIRTQNAVRRTYEYGPLNEEKEENLRCTCNKCPKCGKAQI